MWRSRAIVSTLVEKVADLPEPGDDWSRGLGRAARRARWVVALDWVALLVLLLLRDRSVPFLVLGPTQETLFTIGLFAVAIHSGFRLGQLQKYEAVRRACSALVEREPEG